MSGLGLTFLRRGNLAHPTAGSDYIEFEDAEVLRVLLAKGVSSDGVGITKDDAAAVTSISTWFRANNAISSFNEMIHFTGLTEVSGTSQQGGAFQTSSIRDITLPDSIKKIGTYAFSQCANLVTCSLNQSIEEIGHNAFYSDKLWEGVINLPMLKKVDNVAFTNCQKITAIESLGSITIINGSSSQGGTFQGCNGLTFVRLPATLETIGAYAFWACTGIRTLICEAVVPPSIASTSIPNNASMTIYVPDASVEAYKAATGWNSYAARIKGISEYQG